MLGARAALLVLALLVAGCDVGHSFVADNQTSGSVLARIEGMTMSSSSGGSQPFGFVVIVPARTRLVIAEQPFAGDRVTSIEFLSLNCLAISEFHEFEKGAVFRIRNGPTIEQVDDFPTGDPTAERISACPESSA